MRMPTLTCTALVLLAICQVSHAETVPQHLRLKSIFSVTVDGVLESSGKKIEPQKGTAFAVAPDQLITARHVVGDEKIYANKAATGLLHIPQRTVSIEWLEAEDAAPHKRDISGLFVRPAAVETIDAVRLTKPMLGANALDLSACAVAQGQPYYALIFQNKEVDKPVFVELLPDVYSSTEYGEVYEFYDSDTIFNISPGDSGSPVFEKRDDGSFAVIGLASAVTANKVTVTEVEKFLDLIPQGTRVHCDPRLTKADIAAVVDAKALDLEHKVDALGTRIQTLEERADLADKKAQLAIAFIQKDYDLTEDQIEDLLARASGQDARPIKQLLDAMVDEFTAEDWHIDYSVDQSNDDAFVQLTLSYQRQMKDNQYSPRLFFCIKPLVATLTPYEGDLITEEHFFRLLDSNLNVRDCPQATHYPSSERTKIGAYSYQLYKSVVAADRDDLENWNGIYYIQVVNSALTEDRAVISRILLQLSEDLHNVKRCYRLSEISDVAEVVRALESERLGDAAPLSLVQAEKFECGPG